MFNVGRETGTTARMWRRNVTKHKTAKGAFSVPLLSPETWCGSLIPWRRRQVEFWGTIDLNISDSIGEVMSLHVHRLYMGHFLVKRLRQCSLSVSTVWFSTQSLTARILWRACTAIWVNLSPT
ncbi:hypothetical protein I7I50_11685 [Histoplasma capsulatum G186AR]|uniref:Uncharacterized protein n=1 Tax=Ajellomyces capsulatus TaxID=5037 RepID=A0A8H8D9G1_AJECA|nr:hypothetical protein I7I52_02922 [Histoplasma capsulatum]QSS70146.1 hypothetical protein I7I50_11685 [Histoplasma capsulatum G186AR]